MCIRDSSSSENESGGFRRSLNALWLLKIVLNRRIATAAILQFVHKDGLRTLRLAVGRRSRSRAQVGCDVSMHTNLIGKAGLQPNLVWPGSYDSFSLSHTRRPCSLVEIMRLLHMLLDAIWQI